MSKVAFSKFDLGYPPWALEFDPYNRGYLLVGGGGGEGQKEVPNRITLLDISTRGAIEKVAELDSNADSPMSLGTLATKEGLYAYSGINSVKAERTKGKNEHFRSFKIDYPTRSKEKSAEKKATATIEPVGQTSLFSPTYCSPTGDPYQRLLRLSPALKRTTGNKRIGAVANSLAQESEIVIFNATNASPTASDVIQRIQPIKNAEANDIDIIEQDDGTFLVAYSTKSEVFLTTVSYDFSTRKAKTTLQEPACQYSAPFPDAFQQPGRANLRCLRFLTPEYILLLTTIGSQSELQILRIFSTGGPGEIILRKKLPKGMESCVSMDVCALDADATTGARQIVVAVAAQKQDLSIFTLDYPGPGRGSPSSFRTYKDLRGVHTVSMKKVALSPFHSPHPSSDNPDAEKKTPGPQYLRLASISLSNNLVVDTLPLHPAEPKKRDSRYILTDSSRTSSIINGGSSLLVIAVMLVVSLLLFQSYIQSQSEGASIQLLPQSWQNALDTYRQRAVEISSPLTRRVQNAEDVMAESKPGHYILDLLHTHHKSHHLPDPEKKAIILSAPGEGTEISHEVLPAGGTEAVLAQDANLKKWEELSKTQQKRWKDKLVGAGAWSADYGETIFKGVFFSEIAGAVGRAAAEALAGN
jgi:prolactin regulatory element-binding protein